MPTVQPARRHATPISARWRTLASFNCITGRWKGGWFDLDQPDLVEAATEFAVMNDGSATFTLQMRDGDGALRLILRAGDPSARVNLGELS